MYNYWRRVCTTTCEDTQKQSNKKVLKYSVNKYVAFQKDPILKIFFKVLSIILNCLPPAGIYVSYGKKEKKRMRKKEKKKRKIYFQVEKSFR